jgi:hypothetical protein
MRKLIATGLTALFLAGGTGVALAGHPADDPRDPHKPQDKGLCTAFFNGNKNGWEKNGYPPPFRDLMARADDGNEDTTDDVRTYCGDLIGGNDGPNGNSAGKGRGGI